MKLKSWLLPASLTVLALVSLLTIKSVAPELAAQQGLFFLLAIPLFWLSSRLSLSQIKPAAWWLYLLLNLSLVVALVVGLTTGRTGRWIPLFSRFNIQPSQLAIPIVALTIIRLEPNFNDWLGLTKSLAIMTLPAVLILVEPDLGTTLIYFFSLSSLIFVSQISRRKLALLLGSGLLLMIFAWFFLLQPYQKRRLTSFVDQQTDTQGASYNARQSLIAVGSGQLFGQGLGQGVQSHLRFLPERQTDFIFASFAEEFGFAGSIMIVSLYLGLIGFVFFSGLKSKSPDAFRYCLVIGSMLALQAGVNIGMNIGLLPITGLTLPFLSYGGSSVLSLALMLGLVQAISERSWSEPVLHLT